MRRSLTVAMMVVLGVAFAGCSREAPTAGDGQGEIEAVVRTTFAPTTEFARSIAGGLVEVECPLPPGEDPIFWSPTPEQIGLYQRARLVIVNGAELEKWVPSAAIPRSRVVDTCDSFRDQFIHIEGATHSHGPKGEHSHQGVDGHTWMDPILAIEQARAIQRAMSGAFPEHAEAFERNLEGLIERLRLLDARYRELDTNGVILIASHPAYNYLSRRYGWGVQSLDLDPEAELSEEDLSAITALVRPGTRGVVLWESAPLESTRQRIEDAGLASVVFSPAENPGADEGDYFTIMAGNIERLWEALGG